MSSIDDSYTHQSLFQYLKW